MKFNRRVLVMAVLALAVVGCSTAGAAPSAVPSIAKPDPTPLVIFVTPPPTTPPAATASPVAEPDFALARATYLANATQANKSTDQALKAYNKSSKSLNATRALYAAYAASQRVFNASVRLIKFPASMTEHIDLLLERSSTEEVLLLDMSVAKSFAQMDAIWVKLDDAGLLRSAASNLVRQDLGLPPPPIK